MKNILLWIVAFLITASSAVFQRVTGPTYPVRGKIIMGGQEKKYKFLRSHNTSTDYTIAIADNIKTNDDTLSGNIYFKRYPTNEQWTIISMKHSGGILSGSLPHQPPAGKLEYYVILNKGNNKVRIPDEGSIIMRFKGDTPTLLILIHAIIMFSAMLFSTRAGIEALKKKSELKLYVYWTVGLLFLGGMILGPIVQKYAFGSFWTGFPYGFDLTDNKTLIAFLGWIGALIAVIKGKKEKVWVIGASLLLLLVYLIPHSLLGSELKYNEMNAPSK